MDIRSWLRRYRLKRMFRRYRLQVNVDSSSVVVETSQVRFLVPPDAREYVRIGRGCVLNCTFVFESSQGRVSLGDNVFAGSVTLISRSSIQIGNNVTLAWGITLYDHDSHSLSALERAADMERLYRAQVSGRSPYEAKDWSHVGSRPIVIGDHAWLGFDCVVLKGVTIGEGAVVGARSVVTRDVPPYSVVAGNPARIIKQLR